MASMGSHNDETGSEEMIDCMKCGKPVDGEECPICKWNESKQAYGIQSNTDVSRLCSHISEGQRCANAGVMTPDAMNGGRGGDEPVRWLCWQHSPILRGISETPPPQVEPHSSTLSEAQWYSVCKYFPAIASRCSRPMADVGPHNPLDSESKLGPLLTGLTEDDIERAAIQDEAGVKTGEAHPLKKDSKNWARNILNEAARGTYTSMHGIRCAKIALGIIRED
jgi:hypothetical protein